MSKRILVYGMTDNPGGIESYLLTILDKATNRGIQLDFITDFPTIVYEDILKNAGARIFFIPAKGKKMREHLVEFRRVLKEHPEYETVYFNILDAGAAFSMFIPWIMGRKIISHSHNGNTDKKILHSLCKPFLNIMTDKYVACSKLAAEYMYGERLCSKKDVLIVPNAIDAKKYDYDEKVRNEYREKFGVENHLVICHVGRITNQKNPYRLIDIFAEIYSQRVDAVLLYVGSGELESDVKTYVRERGLDEKVLFLGKRSDIANIMQASDVFLLPSLYEGLPIVAIEAQASGLPCILSSNISEETDITGLVRFLELEEDNTQWAGQVLKSSKQKRKSCLRTIIEAGYDKMCGSKMIDKLLEYFSAGGK